MKKTSGAQPFHPVDQMHGGKSVCGPDLVSGPDPAAGPGGGQSLANGVLNPTMGGTAQTGPNPSA